MLVFKKSKIFVLVVFIYFGLSGKVVASVEYNCPKLPLRVKIGDVVNKNWVVVLDEHWTLKAQGGKLGFLEKYFPKHFGKTYLLKIWDSMGCGNDRLDRRHRKYQYHIECCSDTILNYHPLCLDRMVKESNCISPKNGADFSCNYTPDRVIPKNHK